MREGLHKYTKPQLIEFIRLYNLATHISGYSKMKKKDLVKAIYAKFTINENGDILVNPELKTNINKSSKDIKKVRKAIKEKKNTDNNMLKLVRERGGLRGKLAKYKSEIDNLKEEAKNDYKLKDDKLFIDDYKKKVNEANELIIKIKEVSNKINNLEKKEEPKKEEPKKEEPKKEEPKKEEPENLLKQNLSKNDLNKKRIINIEKEKMPARYPNGTIVSIKKNKSDPIGIVMDHKGSEYIIYPVRAYYDTSYEALTYYISQRDLRPEYRMKLKASDIEKKLKPNALINTDMYKEGTRHFKDISNVMGEKLSEYEPEENFNTIKKMYDDLY
jgi:hypothetical protein